jgi:hypothetical protein
MQVAVSVVVLVEPRSIPKTTSGKIQRHKCKLGFEDGSLKVRCMCGLLVDMLSTHIEWSCTHTYIHTQRVPSRRLSANFPQNITHAHNQPPPQQSNPPEPPPYTQAAYTWEATSKESITQGPPRLSTNKSSFLSPGRAPSLGYSSDEDADDAASYFSCHGKPKKADTN